MRGLTLIALVCCALAVMLQSAHAQKPQQSPPNPHGPGGNKGIESRWRRAAQGPPQGGANGGMNGGFGFNVGANMEGQAGGQGGGQGGGPPGGPGGRQGGH